MMLSEETSAVRPQKQTRFNGAKLVWMLKGSPLTVTGAVIIVLMLLMMIFSPWLATHDPNAIDLTARLLPPSAAHWFGTDEVGRDLFSRVLVGSQQSILAGYSAAIFLIPICISFDTAEKRRYATYLILNRRFSFEF